MDDSKIDSPRPVADSPPPNCAICLGTCTNKCFSDSCMHEFCFKCLLEWSKIKAECPLCKQAFKSIIHNIKSIDEYDEHIVENITVEDNTPYLENSLILLPPGTPPGLHQYHFRTTLTVDSTGEHAIQQMLLTHPLLTIGTFTPDRLDHHRRRRRRSTTTYRRGIYTQNLWAYAPPDITGRYRDVSPSFFINNPAARARLVPWLNRELNALLYENTQQVMHLMDVIMDHLLRHHVCSHMFRFLLSEYMGNKTDHFIHEFYSFMRSPLDMIGYDRHVIYTERRPSPIPYIDVSDYDSDVILVSTTSSNTQENNGNDPVVIDLVDTDSDEPIIVSEERDGSSLLLEEEEEHHRKPILPLKLRLKNRHKSKEKRSKNKKRRHDITSSRDDDIVSSSTSSSSTSTSTSSSSPSSSSDTDWEYKKYQQKKLERKKMVKSKSKRRHENFNGINNGKRTKTVRPVVNECSDTEDDIPLMNFANKRKRSKHSDRRYKSHTVTSTSEDQNKKLESVNKLVSDSSNLSHISGKLVNKFDDDMETKKEPNLREISDLSESFNSIPESSALTLKSEDRSNSGYESNKTDDSFYSERKPYVKSKIRDLRSDDKAGPSSGRLRNILRKDECSNLWYSRPCIYQSDSSDN